MRHFHNLKRQNKFYVKSEQSYADRFRDGFTQCAKEVTKFLYTRADNRAGESIILHLNECMRRLDSLTNASSNMQITNNNNYIPNDTLQLDLNRQQQQSPPSFVVPSSLHHHHLQHQQQQNNNIRQPIAIPLVRKSPIPPQNYVPQLPSQALKLNLSTSALESRFLDNESPLLRPISRDSMSSPPSTSSSPIGHDSMWRPW